MIMKTSLGLVGREAGFIFLQTCLDLCKQIRHSVLVRSFQRIFEFLGVICIHAKNLRFEVHFTTCLNYYSCTFLVCLKPTI